MVVKVDPYLQGFLTRLFDLWHPGVQLVPAVKVVISIEPVIVLLFIPIPNVVVPSVDLDNLPVP
jgi:hypothetical protein